MVLPAECGLVCLTAQSHNQLEKIQSKDADFQIVKAYTLYPQREIQF